MTDDTALRTEPAAPRTGRRRAAVPAAVDAATAVALPPPLDAEGEAAKPKRRPSRRRTPVPEIVPPPPAAPAVPDREIRRIGPFRVDGLWDAAGAWNVKLIYAAYLVSLAVPLAALVGVGLAYLFRRGAPTGWIASHYLYLVRTFWIGLVATAVSTVLSVLGIGVLAPFIAVWLVARAVHGLNRAARAEPIDHPTGLFV